MTTKLDIAGEVYGLLTVLEFIERRKGFSYWKCQCVCGNIKMVRGNQLRTGRSLSCGCVKKKDLLNDVRYQHLTLYGQRVALRQTTCGHIERKHYGQGLIEYLKSFEN